MRFAAGEHQMCMFGCVLFLNHKGSIKYTGEKRHPINLQTQLQHQKFVFSAPPVFQTGGRTSLPATIPFGMDGLKWWPQILRGGYDDRPFFNGAFTLQFSTQRTPEARTLTAT